MPCLWLALGSFWLACGLLVACLWLACGLLVKSVEGMQAWPFRSMASAAGDVSLVCTWCARGVHVVCTWCVGAQVTHAKPHANPHVHTHACAFETKFEYKYEFICTLFLCVDNFPCRLVNRLLVKLFHLVCDHLHFTFYISPCAGMGDGLICYVAANLFMSWRL